MIHFDMKYLMPWEKTDGEIYYRSRANSHINVAEVYCIPDAPQWSWEIYARDMDFKPCAQGKSNSKEQAIIACDEALIKFGWKLVKKKLLVMG
jgi:hypothetical protein